MTEESARKDSLANRETWLRAREEASGAHDLVVAEREELVLRREQVLLLREQALNLRRDADRVRSDRERLVMQLRDANEKLVVASLRSEELAEAALASEGQAAALSSANDRAKDAFLAMLGHELRNPLAAVTSALDVMELKVPDLAIRERSIIAGQIGQITGLVDDLLDLSRIVEGKLELVLEPVELHVVVLRALETAEPAIRRMNHTVTVDVAARGLLVDGDLRRLTQVVANVLTNAAKYTPSRGEIAITAEARDTTIVLRIRDTGIGISPEMLPHVFDLFSQEDRARPRSQGGLGLGLSLVHRLVTMHGGTVLAASDGVGCGSQIEIVLPASLAISW